jgi:hypothetical protein
LPNLISDKATGSSLALTMRRVLPAPYRASLASATPIGDLLRSKPPYRAVGAIDGDDVSVLSVFRIGLFNEAGLLSKRGQ